MTKREVTNVAASVHDRLLKLARERNEDFNLTLTKYGLERFLYRLSKSKYREQFVLKGALLLELWTEQRYRPTRDVDFLAYGDNDPDRLAFIFREICVIDVGHHDDDEHEEEVRHNDGCRFDPDSVVASQIKESDDYQGVRVTLDAYLEKIRIQIQADIGFGDAVTPAPYEAEYPSMLGMPQPTLLAYPLVTSIAEKFEAMVKLGIANSRMKDIHDIRTLLKNFNFKGSELQEAIRRTFERRKTPFPSAPSVIFSDDFIKNEPKLSQWKAFATRNRSFVGDESLESALLAIRDFLMPVVNAIMAGEQFESNWTPGGSWDYAD
jgi:hypothetical protein